MDLVKKKTYDKLMPEFLKQSGLNEGAFRKEVSFAIQVLKSNEYMLKCDAESVMKAVMNIAQTGLTLNPVSKLAYLVPRWNNKTKLLECCLDPSYMGLVKLLTDSGSVKSIECNIVYEGDEIEVDFASEDKITKHTPYMFAGAQKGKIKACYSIAVLENGSKHVEIMSNADIEEIRGRSESYKAYKNGKTKTCIWVSDEGEMYRKTVIKRHYKYLPKSNVNNIDYAVELDNYASGFRKSVSTNSVFYIDELLRNCTLSPEEIIKLESDLRTIEYQDQADKMITYLKENQTQDLDEEYKQITKGEGN